MPSSCWFTNVRSCIVPGDRTRLRRAVLDRAGHACEACGDGPDRDAGRWLEVHERWAQALRRIICLCTRAAG